MSFEHAERWRITRVATLFASVFLALAFGAGTAVASESCPQADSAGTPEQSDVQQVPLGSEGKSELTVKTKQYAFGEGRDPLQRTIVLSAKPKLKAGATVIAEVAGDLETEEGGAFPVEGVTTAATVNKLGNVRLSLCLDPSEPEEVGRGRYVGAVQVGGPGIETASVPLEVTLRKSICLALVLALIGMLFGLAVKMLADLSKDPKAKIKGRWIKAYMARGGFWSAVLLGFAGVGLSLWQLYDLNPIWGAPEDLFKIWAAGAALQVSGTTLVDFFKPFIGSNTPPAADEN
jgi:hypothetical protein